MIIRPSFIVHRLSLVVLSAVLLILSFPGFNLWILAWVAFVPLLFALDNQKPLKAFLTAYLTGFLFFLGAIYWLIHVSLPGMIAVAAYLALYFGIFGLIISRRSQYSIFSTQYTRLFLIPAIWVALEWIRGHALTGFGWALMGYSQTDNLPIIQIADIFGVYGVSFLVLIVNLAIFYLIKNFRRKEEFIVPVFMASVLIFIALGYGIFRTNNIFTGEKLKVAVVQGNIPQDQKWDERFVGLIMERYGMLTNSLSETKPDLIIWPETSVPGFIENQNILMKWVKGLAIGANAPILVGAPRYEITKTGDVYYNSAFLFLNDGSLARHYDKMHLVPFGEYVPLKSLFFFVHRFAPRPIGDFVGGKEFTVLKFISERSAKEKDYSLKLVKRIGFGCLICFEDVFPELARGLVRNGAGFLVNITNDAWFGKSSAAYQHAQASVFRAVENRVNVVRAANTGLSCFIDQKGRIVSRVSGGGRDLFVEGFKAQEIALSRIRTIYTTYGDIFAYACLFFTCLYIMANMKKRPIKIGGRG